MAEFDLKGSIAHVTMLGETGIITKEEALQIKQGLEELLEEYKAGKLEFDVSNEDIHMNMESLLTAKIGPVAGKLHTARSRNDQVATDMHLYLKAKLVEVIEKLDKFTWYFSQPSRQTYLHNYARLHPLAACTTDFFWSPLDGLLQHVYT